MAVIESSNVWNRNINAGLQLLSIRTIDINGLDYATRTINVCSACNQKSNVKKSVCKLCVVNA